MGDYLHWSEAGGPNECEHGYAEGIPCPDCDGNPKQIALKAEIERLKQRWPALAENERLRRENWVLRDIIAMTNPCIHQQILDAEFAHADGRSMSVDEYMAARGVGERLNDG